MIERLHGEAVPGLYKRHKKQINADINEDDLLAEAAFIMNHADEFVGDLEVAEELEMLVA